MSAFGRALSAEIDHLARDRWDQALLVLMPLILLGLMAAMLLSGVPRDLPIAIVGGGETPLARRFVQAINDSSAVAVVARSPSEAAGLSLVRQGRIVAFVELPDDIRPNKSATVRISYNAAYLSTGGIAESAISKALGSAAVQAIADAGGVGGVTALRLPDAPVSISILANPEASFEWYLQALVDPAVLHLLIACATAMAMGRALTGKSLSEWRAQTGGGVGALAGKMAPYVAIGTAWGAAWLIWIAGIRGWQPVGSLALILFGQAVLMAATAAISALLVIASRETSNALAVCAVYAGSALAYSGGSLPVQGGSLFARGWSGFLPFTHYLDLQMDQWLGAPVQVAIRQLLILSVYIVIPLALSALLMRRERVS
ncbi:ABC transporter permease [Sphingomonas jaspsi]|uniref:ABC transporter permease n=1 Tax=Sphingomonas jaspsi TaxID=392409 RepID=UPI0004B2C16F|nr:ABC transporter permease [Sphingomonas jaspsi]